MNIRKLRNFQIDDYILMALKEDIPYEDISSQAIYKDDDRAEVSLISKDEGILAGLDVYKRVFTLLDENIIFKEYKSEGDKIFYGDLILDVEGKVNTLLSGERLALNFLQRMSGIATSVSKMIEVLDDENIAIVDTRKTTPNMRIFEKYAVKVGGGYNHRMNASDGILLKDNHINMAGSVTEAVKRARAYAPFIKKVEVEVENLDMVKEAIDIEADIIMLDNMDINMVKDAIEIIDGRALIECSGNITYENVSRYRGLDIDFISSGSIHYDAPILDLSMRNLRGKSE